MPGTIINQPFDVAIVGGGIIGLMVAMGLMKRNINVKIYEQSRSFREIGAGVAFTANAIRCMGIINPDIVTALRKVTTANGDPENPNDYLQYVDGYNHDPEDADNMEEELLFKLYAGYKGFEGCHRAHLLDQLVKFIPEGTVEFRKRLDTYVDRGADQKLLLKFCDGTTTEVDAIIGCDGIKSRVRELILGEGNPASYSHYSHKVAFRALIPMDKAEAALGSYKARNQHMHMGPGAHVLHFAVANQTLMNFVAFAPDPNEWPSDTKALTAPATKAEVVKIFSDWGPTVRAIVDLLPDELDKWAIFDTYDFPAPTYTRGRACIAGDAAHASSPHHGAGAGIGVEDALAMAQMLEMATETLQSGATSVTKAQVLRSAFQAFDAVRRERSQWLVHSSRHICDVYEWNDPRTGSNPDRCLEEIKWRSHKIWYFNIEGMLLDARKEYQKIVAIQL